MHFISRNAEAQPDGLKFNLVENPDGKPFGKIRNIIQDPQGYMWFSGETEHCIFRYDGNRVHAFRHDDTNPNSLGGTSINSVYADNSGIIWIGLNDGLDQFNPATGVFKHYRHVANDRAHILGVITPIVRDRKGRLWAGGSEGLFLLNEQTGEFIHYRNEPGNKKSLSSNYVWTIYEDRQGDIWVGTGFPWFNSANDGIGGLNRLNPDGSFTRYLHDPKDPNSLINNKIAAILEDSRGVFWVGTSGDGLHTMDRKSGRFERHRYDPAHPDKLSRPPEKPQGSIPDKITFINEDSTGSIWIGTRSSGLTRYDPSTKKITRFEASNGFPDYSSWNAFTSKDGVLWITTEQNHLYRIDPFKETIGSFPTTDQPLCFLEDPQRRLWVGTKDGGLLEYDQQKNLVNTYKHDSTENIILCLFQKSMDSIWVGTLGGIFIVNKQTGHLSPWPYNRKLRDSEGSGIYKIYQDSHGMMWFSQWGGGLIKYNPAASTFKRFRFNPNDSVGIISNAITDIIEDRSGNLWISGLGRAGVSLISRNDHFRHYLAGNSAWDLYMDSEGKVWAGTDKGLFWYSDEVDKFLLFFDQHDQLSTDKIHAIVEDKQRNLWVTSPSAIVKIAASRNNVSTFGNKFGILPMSLQLKSIFQSENGQILVGHEKGFYAFFPEELAINSSSAKIMVTDLFINNVPIVAGETSILQKPIGEVDEIALKYNQNNLTFDFTVPDYRAPESIKFYTMLENHDDVWRPVKGEKSSFYFNVRPGNYVYRLKAFNSDGVKMEKSINIRINPPWWQTWTFRISAIVLVISAFYAIVRWRVQQRFRQQLERSEKERQVAELKQKGVELEMQALRAQMNPHFIFNSLNSINRFILQNNKAQASEYLTKFSKLVRMILHNSQASLITLESELESLELYLNLEGLRFNYHFDYKISVPRELDISSLKVPPLILQPFVENAIWHGLMHKEEKGQLDINVSGEDNYLYFKITDNGIGRKKAEALSSKSATKHKSMGLRITTNRIAILNNSHSTMSPVTFNDLVHPDGSAAGTEVTIKMPIVYD